MAIADLRTAPALAEVAHLNVGAAGRECLGGRRAASPTTAKRRKALEDM